MYYSIDRIASYNQSNLHSEMLSPLKRHRLTESAVSVTQTQTQASNTHLVQDFHDEIAARVNSMHKFQYIQAEFPKMSEKSTKYRF